MHLKTQREREFPRWSVASERWEVSVMSAVKWYDSCDGISRNVSHPGLAVV